jgi:hypothetical protein
MISLQQSIELVKVGKKSEARQALIEIVREAPNNVTAWFWLVEAIESDAQRVKVLEECLKHNPEREEVSQALEKFRARLPEDVQNGGPDPKQGAAGQRKGSKSARQVPVWLWMAIIVNAALFVILAAIGLVG